MKTIITLTLTSLLISCNFNTIKQTAKVNPNSDLSFDKPYFNIGTLYPNGSVVFKNEDISVMTSYVNIGSVDIPSMHFGHCEIVADEPHPFVESQLFYIRGASLSVEFAKETQHVEFDYWDLGGIINITPHSNGENKTFIGKMSQLPNFFNLNGVNIIKTNISLMFNMAGEKIGERGKITLLSIHNISDFKIGGHELYLDNFYFKKTSSTIINEVVRKYNVGKY